MDWQKLGVAIAVWLGVLLFLGLVVLLWWLAWYEKDWRRPPTPEETWCFLAWFAAGMLGGVLTALLWARM